MYFWHVKSHIVSITEKKNSHIQLVSKGHAWCVYFPQLCLGIWWVFQHPAQSCSSEKKFMKNWMTPYWVLNLLTRLKGIIHFLGFHLNTLSRVITTTKTGNFASSLPPLWCMWSSFHVFPHPVADFCYEWRENIVSVTSDVIEIKGAASNTYKYMCA